MWKEAVVGYLEVLTRHLPLNRAISEHKVTTWVNHPVIGIYILSYAGATNRYVMNCTFPQKFDDHCVK
jgi:hypothetical protein